ncbi:hypothetical protein BCAH1134_C0141 (plasmid) [Bacillus cereus AH1134]|nr:hypothetical protein BCAH1134_C0141 [Bacillus cereus AH1134]
MIKYPGISPCIRSVVIFFKKHLLIKILICLNKLKIPVYYNP